MANEESFPRDLTPLERDLLLWLLPADRPGYRGYRTLVSSWQVGGKGRRGEGDYVLTPSTISIDNESPLPPVFAYGTIKAEEGRISVTVRERVDEQIEFEITNLDGESVPSNFTEKNRWSFSTWLPMQGCPICSKAVREIPMSTELGRHLVLAFCRNDAKTWVYDGENGVNHLIPLTNFYNELMLQANVRDPKIALDSKKLFADLANYPDETLLKAFVSYNAMRTKITVHDRIQIQRERKPSLLRRLRSHILKSERL